MIELNDLPMQDQLDQINKAITAVLAGGQNYKIASRSLTRADLGELRAMKAELAAKINAASKSSLLGDTFVAEFNGR